MFEVCYNFYIIVLCCSLGGGGICEFLVYICVVRYRYCLFGGYIKFQCMYDGMDLLCIELNRQRV